MRIIDTSNSDPSPTENWSLCKILSKHCRHGNTGIIFIATKNNMSCKIFIKKGEIQAANMRNFEGEAAIYELNRVGIKGCSYSDRIRLSYSKKDYVDSNNSVLDQLGCNIENSLNFWSMRKSTDSA